MLFPPATSVLFKSIVDNMVTPELLHIYNAQKMLPIHIASFYHNINLVVAMIDVSPETMYAKTTSGKTIFDFWDLASLRNKCRLISHVLSMDYPVLEEFWSFFPKPLQYFEQYVRYIRSEHLERSMDHVTKKARQSIRDKLLALSSCISRNSIRFENDLVAKIVLRSM